jgi:hypothetical protein
MASAQSFAKRVDIGGGRKADITIAANDVHFRGADIDWTYSDVRL